MILVINMMIKVKIQQQPNLPHNYAKWKPSGWRKEHATQLQHHHQTSRPGQGGVMVEVGGRGDQDVDESSMKLDSADDAGAKSIPAGTKSRSEHKHQAKM